MNGPGRATTSRRASDALAQARLFQGIPEAALRDVVDSAEVIEAASGERLFSEGEPGTFLLLIMQGSVSVFSGLAGREDYLTLLGAGDTVGEMSLLNGDLRSGSAMVIEKARLARIDVESIRRLKTSSPAASETLMANALRLTSDRLRESNRRFQKLARLGEEARERVEQMRSQILSLISHELRTPLTVIKTSAQVLRRTDAGDGLQGGFIEKIEAHTERLRLIVEDLISLSTLVARPCLTRVECIDVNEALAATVESQRDAAEEKRIVIECSPPELAPEVSLRGDEALLRRSLQHLLANAIRFSPENTTVRVLVERPDDDSIRLVFLDRGPGFEGPTERLMQLFSQAEDALVRENEGLGIGLTLARQTALAHGGTLEAANRPRGGARVSFTLPLRPPLAGLSPSQTWNDKERKACQLPSPRF